MDPGNFMFPAGDFVRWTGDAATPATIPPTGASALVRTTVVALVVTALGAAAATIARRRHTSLT